VAARRRHDALRIPGSGTSNSGFGVIYKSKANATYEEVLVRDPGGMKVAQSYNPERRAGDLGLTRAGLSYILEDENDRAIGANREHRFDLALENLKRCTRASSRPDPLRRQRRFAGRRADVAGAYGRAACSPRLLDAHEILIVATGVDQRGPRTMDYSRRATARSRDGRALPGGGSKDIRLKRIRR
jgi:hypothetical protein